jgi:hypothetical protein
MNGSKINPDMRRENVFFLIDSIEVFFTLCTASKQNEGKGEDDEEPTTTTKGAEGGELRLME